MMGLGCKNTDGFPSCVFMLPVVTVSNAIAYSTGNVRMQDMARERAVLSLVAQLVIAGMNWLLLV